MLFYSNYPSVRYPKLRPLQDFQLKEDKHKRVSLIQDSHARLDDKYTGEREYKDTTESYPARWDDVTSAQMTKMKINNRALHSLYKDFVAKLLRSKYSDYQALTIPAIYLCDLHEKDQKALLDHVRKKGQLLIIEEADEKSNLVLEANGIAEIESPRALYDPTRHFEYYVQEDSYVRVCPRLLSLNRVDAIKFYARVGALSEIRKLIGYGLTAQIANEDQLSALLQEIFMTALTYQHAEIIKYLVLSEYITLEFLRDEVFNRFHNEPKVQLFILGNLEPLFKEMEMLESVKAAHEEIKKGLNGGFTRKHCLAVELRDTESSTPYSHQSLIKKAYFNYCLEGVLNERRMKLRHPQFFEAKQQDEGRLYPFGSDLKKKTEAEVTASDFLKAYGLLQKMVADPTPTTPLFKQRMRELSKIDCAKRVLDFVNHWYTYKSNSDFGARAMKLLANFPQYGFMSNESDAKVEDSSTTSSPSPLRP